MRTIEQSTAFRRDFKRENKGRHRETPDAELTSVLPALAADVIIDARLRDHALSGEGYGYR
jgi:mRNA interferase YafQ